MTPFETSVSAMGGSAALALVLGWLARTWISERLHQAIAHEYAEKLERHKVELSSAAAVELEKLRSAQAQERAIRGLGEDHLREALRVAHTKRIEAIPDIWEALVALAKRIPKAVRIAEVLAEGEIVSMNEHPPSAAALSELSMASIQEQVFFSPTEIAGRSRLLAGESLYALFAGYRSIVGRGAIVMMHGRDTGKMFPWYREETFLRLFALVFPPDEVEEFSRITVLRMEWIRQRVESKFIEAANRVISGETPAIDAIQQARAIEAAAIRAATEQLG
jgi:hypothetical protein